MRSKLGNILVAVSSVGGFCALLAIVCFIKCGCAVRPFGQSGSGQVVPARSIIEALLNAREWLDAWHDGAGPGAWTALLAEGTPQLCASANGSRPGTEPRKPIAPNLSHYTFCVHNNIDDPAYRSSPPRGDDVDSDGRIVIEAWGLDERGRPAHRTETFEPPVDRGTVSSTAPAARRRLLNTRRIPVHGRRKLASAVRQLFGNLMRRGENDRRRQDGLQQPADSEGAQLAAITTGSTAEAQWDYAVNTHRVWLFTLSIP